MIMKGSHRQGPEAKKMSGIGEGYSQSKLTFRSFGVVLGVEHRVTRGHRDLRS